jgi:hypothetical protein
MVPQTFPSSYVTANGKTRMVVESLASVTGLVRWKDYIPVKDTSPYTANSYNNDGAMELEILADTTGKVAGKDYIKIYVDSAATKAWQVSSDGYIPVSIPS